MDYKISNQIAIIEAEKTYGRLSDVEDSQNPSEVIYYLRLLGLSCSKCGKKNITFPTLKFYHFSPSVICYNCQHN